MPPSARPDAGGARAATLRPIRQHNRVLVLGAIAAQPGRSRAQLADHVGLSRATVSSLVDDLVADRLVRELPAERAARGRPALPLVLEPDGPAGLGVELNVDHAVAVVVDLTGAIRARDHVALPGPPGPAATVRRLASLAGRVTVQSGLEVAHAAVAVPGLLDRSGVVRRLPNLPHWQRHDIAGELAAAVGVGVRADNEANFAALADLHLGTVGRDFLHVSGEIGVGGAVVVDGVLYRGARGFGGEIGHTVVDPAGPACGCGARGCLEQYAGRTAILRAAGSRTVDDLVDALDRGATQPIRALEEAGRVLGLALADAVTLFDVPTVVLGGLYARLFPWLHDAARSELDGRALVRDVGGTTVVRSAYGVDAAAVGAALSVVDDILGGRVLPADERPSGAL